ncbi:hypothetical protein L2755_11925 [Shewanella abyssi]|nr:hypothetical protein [Shewanella abyssi]MCL1050332.1 hypothetical protein [Shewanella abyssi]
MSKKKVKSAWVDNRLSNGWNSKSTFQDKRIFFSGLLIGMSIGIAIGLII